MQLSELFTRLPEDYYHSPIKGDPGSPDNLPSFDPKYAKVIGTMSGHDIWGSREVKDREIYGIKEVETVIAYLIIDEREVSPRVYIFNELWVAPSRRRAGLGATLILFLLQKLHISLALTRDSVVSADARALIGQLVSSKKIKARDGSGQDLNPESLKDLTKNDLEITLYEDRPRESRLFGHKMLLPDGRVTLAEQNQVGPDWY